jgi:hypothetical protein
VEWRPGDGRALGVPVPAEPFARTNDAAGFRALAKLEDAG